MESPRDVCLLVVGCWLILLTRVKGDPEESVLCPVQNNRVIKIYEPLIDKDNFRSRDHLVIRLKSEGFVFIRLVPLKDSDSETLEVKFDANTIELKNYSTKPSVTLLSQNSETPLNMVAFTPFWLRWGPGTQVQVGSGSTVNENQTLEYTLESPLEIRALNIKGTEPFAYQYYDTICPITTESPPNETTTESPQNETTTESPQNETGAEISTCLSPLRNNPGDWEEDTLIDEESFRSRDHVVIWVRSWFMGIALIDPHVTDDNNTVVKWTSWSAAIRKCSSGLSRCEKIANETQPVFNGLNNVTFTPFWLRWGPEAQVQLGSGRHVGENPILEHTFASPLNVRSLLIAGSNPVSYQYEDDAFCPTTMESPQNETTTDSPQNVTGAESATCLSPVQNQPEGWTPPGTLIDEENFRSRDHLVIWLTAGYMGIALIEQTISSDTRNIAVVWSATGASILDCNSGFLDSNTIIYTPISTGLSDVTFTPFWLRWGPEAVVQLGRGRHVGENPILEHTFASPLNVRSLLIAGSNPISYQYEDDTFCPRTTESPPNETTTEPPPNETTTESPPNKTTMESPLHETTTESPRNETTPESRNFFFPRNEATTESPPNETTRESPPNETTTESPPNETIRESPPNETTRESPPNETTRESPPNETTTESPPNETTTTPTQAQSAPPTPRKPGDLPPKLSTPCHCIVIRPTHVHNNNNSNAEDLQREREALAQKKLDLAASVSRELSVTKTNVSASVRRKTSAGDQRVSSSVLGFAVALVCFLPLALIVVADVSAGLYHLVRQLPRYRPGATVGAQP